MTMYAKEVEESPEQFDVFESRRKDAIEAVYGVQGAIRLIFEGRLQPDSRPLTGDEYRQIMDLKNRVMRILCELSPNLEDCELPIVEVVGDTVGD